MTRAEVKAFIQSGVTALNPSLPFGTGRISEFDSERSHEYPMCWLETLTVSAELSEGTHTPYNQWTINLHIAKKDAADSSASQYESIIDEADLIAQQLIHKYNSIITGYERSWITGIGRDPFIKKHADCLTGVLLSFTLNDIDTTNLC